MFPCVFPCVPFRPGVGGRSSDAFAWIVPFVCTRRVWHPPSLRVGGVVGTPEVLSEIRGLRRFRIGIAIDKIDQFCTPIPNLLSDYVVYKLNLCMSKL